MTEEDKPKFKINKGRKKIGPTGMIIEEEWVSIETDNRKDCEEMFDKRWKE